MKNDMKAYIKELELYGRVVETAQAVNMHELLRGLENDGVLGLTGPESTYLAALVRASVADFIRNSR